MKANSCRISRSVFSFTVAAAVLLLAACPNPITQDTFNQLNDKNPPSVTINSPSENSVYTQTVTVRGSVADTGGRLNTLSYKVSGTLGELANGQVELTAISGDGAFSFQFSTLAFNGPIAVEVLATDWNGNAANARITLAASGNSISSFSATPLNKSVRLDWEPISGATYTVYYTTNGTLPSQNYGNVITPGAPPYTLPELKNGGLHVFLLQASTSSADYWSGYCSAIPLSPFTLAPTVTGAYRQIDLEWNPIDGTSQFEVYRDTNPNGSFPKYSGVITGNTFTDTNVFDNGWYYYKVKPTMPGSVISTYNGARPFQLPPSKEESMSTISTPGMPDKIRIFGEYAFVAAGTTGLLVMDVSVPSAPRVAASLATTNAKDIELSTDGNYAFVADGSGGLRIIDISNPFSPGILATYDAWSGAGDLTDVAAVSDHAYVINAATPTVVYGINISTPAAPAAAGSSTSINNTSFYDIAATMTSGTRTLFVCSGGTAEGLYRIRHTPPSTYVAAGPYADGSNTSVCAAVLPTTTAASNVFVLSMPKAIVSGGFSYPIKAVSVNTLTLTGQYTGWTTGTLRDISVYGSKAYASDGIGLQVVNFNVPASPSSGGFWNTPGTPFGVVSNGSFAFVAAGSLGFQTVDLSAPVTAPTFYSQYAATNLSSVTLRGDYVYAAIGGASPRLQVIAISTLSSPVTRGSQALVMPVHAALAGDYAVVANNRNPPNPGIQIVNISDPDAPLLVGSAPGISGYPTRVVVKGDYAYMTGSTGLQVFDISDPANPIGVGFFDSDAASTMNDVTIRGSLLYFVQGGLFAQNNFNILDISNPTTPVRVAKVTGWGGNDTLIGVSVKGDYAFITDSNSAPGLYAVNVNPSSGAYLTRYGPCSSAPNGEVPRSDHLAIAGGYAYVCDSNSGLAVIDISDPTAFTGGLPLSNLALDNPTDIVIPDGRYAFVSDGDGLEIIKLY